MSQYYKFHRKKIVYITKLFLVFLPLILVSGCASGAPISLPVSTQVSSTPNNFEAVEPSEKIIQELLAKNCAGDDSNVYMTECAIALLDKKSAEREWKQRKIENLKHPQVNQYDLTGDLKEWEGKITNWRTDFEKMRDTWCDAKFSFLVGSGVPYDVTICKLGLEVRAIGDLNYLYYDRIMKGVNGSEGVPDFEPKEQVLDELIKTNKTKRGCVWAGEEKQSDCVPPIKIGN